MWRELLVDAVRLRGAGLRGRARQRRRPLAVRRRAGGAGRGRRPRCSSSRAASRPSPTSSRSSPASTGTSERDVRGPARRAPSRSRRARPCAGGTSPRAPAALGLAVPVLLLGALAGRGRRRTCCRRACCRRPRWSPSRRVQFFLGERGSRRSRASCPSRAPAASTCWRACAAARVGWLLAVGVGTLVGLALGLSSLARDLLDPRAQRAAGRADLRLAAAGAGLVRHRRGRGAGAHLRRGAVARARRGRRRDRARAALVRRDRPHARHAAGATCGAGSTCRAPCPRSSPGCGSRSPWPGPA